MTENSIWSITRETARLISAAGFDVSGVNFSINRNGDYSAYFSIHGHFYVRISDHSTVRMYGSSGYFVVNPESAEKTAAEIIAELTSEEYQSRKIAAEKAAAERTAALEARREQEEAAAKARLDSIKAEQNDWIAAKARFFAARPELAAAKETVRNKAWREYKKAMA